MIKRLIKFVIMVGVLFGLGFWGYMAVVNRDLNVNRFFVGNEMLGVDVSSYQENVDFVKLKEQGVEFAYIKATEGATHVDETFAEKWAAVAEAGMPAGAYHYFLYGVSGVTQAENFIATVGDLNGLRLIPAVDMELTMEEVDDPPEKSEVVRGPKAFLAIVEEKYGVKPLIYAQKDYYDKYLADDFADYPRWVRNVFYPVWIENGDDWVVWQYDDRGVMDGYGGEKYIDMNIVNSKKGLDALMVK